MVLILNSFRHFTAESMSRFFRMSKTQKIITVCVCYFSRSAYDRCHCGSHTNAVSIKLIFRQMIIRVLIAQVFTECF